MSNLFEEAITDAKKLKEVAEENAKKAILESITPQIREFIEESLLEADEDKKEKEEESEEEGEKDKKENQLDEEVYLDESALASLAELIGEENLDSLNESKSKTALFSAIKGAVASMDDDDRDQLLNLSHRLSESANNLSSKRGETMSRKYYEVDLSTLREAINDMGEGDYHMEEEELEDITNEELIAELSALFEQEEAEEAPEDAGEELPDFPADEGPALDEDENIDRGAIEAAVEEFLADLSELGLDVGAAGGEEAEPVADLGGEFELPDAPEEPGAEEEIEALAEAYNVNPRVLRQEINRAKRLMAEGKVDHHFGGKGGGKAGVKGAFGGTGNKKVGVNGAFGGGKPGQDPFVNPPQINKLNEAIRNLRRQNRAQSEKLNKYRGAVDSLREQLEDLNLFNAKLLYVNKLLQNKTLSESQKKSVIKALDEAATLSEAKSLYTSLTETLSRGSSKGTLSESRILGSSSRATTSSQSTATSSNNELSRWQKLAGL